jgi:hypothetical protein
LEKHFPIEKCVCVFKLRKIFKSTVLHPDIVFRLAADRERASGG